MGKRPTQIIDIEQGGEFTVCPECGYTDGFHSVFENFNTQGQTDWLLICPRCSSKYDIGLKYTPKG